MAAMTMISGTVRAGVLAFGLGLAALAVPQLLDTAAAETTDAAPASTAGTADSARPDPAGPRARVTRLGETRRAPAATPSTPAQTAARTSATTPAAATAATPWTPLPARPRYRSPESPAAAAPRPSEPLLRGVSGTSVEVKNRSNDKLVLQLDPDGVRGGTPGDYVFLEPDQSASFSGYHASDGTNAVDVRLLVSLANEPAATATRMVIVANNPWNLPPSLFVAAADPSIAATDKPLNLAYVAYKPRKYLWVDSFSELKEGEGCACDAPDSGGPAYGPQVYVSRKSDSDDYKNFFVEIFNVGQYPTEDYAWNPQAVFLCDGNGRKVRQIPKGVPTA